MTEKLLNIKEIRNLAKKHDDEELTELVAGSKTFLPYTVQTKSLTKANFPELKNRQDVSDRLVKFAITTEIEDRSNHIVKVEGVQLKNYKKNPVILFAHDNKIPPIGRSVLLKREVKSTPKQLLSVGEFFEEDVFPFSETIYKMVVKGYLNAVSIGFVPLDIKVNRTQDDRIQLVFNKTELVEYSVVPVPDNPEALVLDKSFDNGVVKQWLSQVIDTWDETEYGLIFPRKKVENAYKVLNNKTVTSGKKPLKISKSEQLELLRKNLESIKGQREEKMSELAKQEKESANETEEFVFHPYVIKDGKAENTETKEVKDLYDEDGQINNEVAKEIITGHAEYLQNSGEEAEKVEKSLLELGKFLGIEIPENQQQEKAAETEDEESHVEEEAEIVTKEADLEGEDLPEETVEEKPETVEKEIKTEETETEQKDVDIDNSEEITKEVEVEDSEEDKEEIPEEAAVVTKDNQEQENEGQEKRIVIKAGDISVEIVGHDGTVAKEIFSTIAQLKSLETKSVKEGVADGEEQNQIESEERTVAGRADAPDGTVNKDLATSEEKDLSAEEIKSIVEEVFPEVLDEIINLEKEVRKGNLDLILGEKE